MKNKTKGTLLGWTTVFVAFITNPHRAIVIPILWGLSWLGEKAEAAADWTEENTPVFFSEKIESMYKKAVDLGDKDG